MVLGGSICELPADGHRVMAVCRIIRIAGGLPGQIENHSDRCVMGQTQGGEILVSDVVRHSVEGKEYGFSDRGAADLKGFEEPVRLFEVRWGD